MRRTILLLLVAAMLLGGGSLLCAPVLAGANDPLFINMTTEGSHRSMMALTFGANQMERGHPLTIFLNDEGVKVGSKKRAKKYAEHQRKLAEMMAKGAVVISCPMCMRHYEVKEADLLPGVQLGNPELTGGALFKDNTRTLTW